MNDDRRVVEGPLASDLALAALARQVAAWHPEHEDSRRRSDATLARTVAHLRATAERHTDVPGMADILARLDAYDARWATERPAGDPEERDAG